ncbi:MAG: hypothetical protein WCK42_10200, partial [Myxococcaceae bacterium]
MTNTQKICPELAVFLSQPKKLMINGEWVPSQSNKQFAVENPANTDVLAHVAHGDATDINLA